MKFLYTTRGMAACPPYTVLNPQTMRCVKITGRRGQRVLKYGLDANVPALEGAAPVYMKAKGQYGIAAAFGVEEPNRGIGAFWERPYGKPEGVGKPEWVGKPEGAVTAAARLMAAQQLGPQPCAPGQNRNPATGRCIKMTGRTYKRLYPSVAPAPFPQAPRLAATLLPPAPLRPRRESTEGPTRLPVGTAQPAPLGDPAATQSWIRDNCKNKRDPISGIAWTDADTTSLQDVIRLHERTCTLASGLNNAVKAEHKVGKPATVPGDPTTTLTLDDFKALRTTMRRRDPAYKLPRRSHQPTPANWQLYVASDNRSGPEFASVLIVDVTKARATPTGFEYPTESVKIDLGFIPAIPVPGALCQPQMLVQLLDQLAKNNRLLEPVAGGWKPVFTPRGKAYWGPDRTEKIGRLCRDLTRALTTPL